MTEYPKGINPLSIDPGRDPDQLADTTTFAPIWRGDFLVSDFLPPQRHESGTTYWRYVRGQGPMMYYCPDDPEEEHDRDLCHHHHAARETLATLEGRLTITGTGTFRVDDAEETP